MNMKTFSHVGKSEPLFFENTKLTRQNKYEKIQLKNEWFEIYNNQIIYF